MALLSPVQQPNVHLVDTLAELDKVVKVYAKRGTRIFADTETTGFNPRTGKLVSIQLWQGKGMPVVIDWRRFQGEDANLAALLLGEDGPLGNLTWVFHNASFDLAWLGSAGIWVRKVYDTLIAEQVIYGVGMDGGGLSLKDLVYKYAQQEMSKEERNWFIDLDTRVDLYTGPGPDYLELESRPWDEPFPTEQLEYMGEDVRYLPIIFDNQVAELKRRKMMPVAALEMRVVPAISYMQSCGIKIDVDKWRAVIQEQEVDAKRLEAELLTSELAMAILKSRTEEYETAKFELEMWQQAQQQVLDEAKRIHTLSSKGDMNYEELSFLDISPEIGEKWGAYKKRVLAEWKEFHPRPETPKANLLEVNMGSSQQLKAGLSLLGINLPDTEKETLEKAAGRFPVLKPLLDFRQAQKFVSSFGERLLARVEEDGRIHPQYQQIGAATGRMSCRSPNMQQIPARTEVGKKLRQAVIAEEGHFLLTADYSIIELRILAQLAKNKVMLDMFESGADLHNFTTRRMFNLGPEITDDEIEGKRAFEGKPLRLAKYNNLKARDVAKTINYGVAYGQSAFGFSDKFQVDVDTAQGFIDKYYEGFTGLGDFLKKLQDFGEKHLYSQTVLGRKRYYELPELDGSYETAKFYRKIVSGIRRKAANHAIQGTSADITKEATALIYEWLQTCGIDVRIVAVVHDEIVLEVPEQYAVTVAAVQGELMYQAARKYLPDVAIPVPAPHQGKTWEH